MSRRRSPARSSSSRTSRSPTCRSRYCMWWRSRSRSRSPVLPDFDWQDEYPGEEVYVYTVPETAVMSPQGKQSPPGLTIGLARLTEDRAPNPGEMREADERGRLRAHVAVRQVRVVAVDRLEAAEAAPSRRVQRHAAWLGRFRRNRTVGIAALGGILRRYRGAVGRDLAVAGYTWADVGTERLPFDQFVAVRACYAPPGTALYHDHQQGLDRHRLPAHRRTRNAGLICCGRRPRMRRRTRRRPKRRPRPETRRAGEAAEEEGSRQADDRRGLREAHRHEDRAGREVTKSQVSPTSMSPFCRRPARSPRASRRRCGMSTSRLSPRRGRPRSRRRSGTPRSNSTSTPPRPRPRSRRRPRTRRPPSKSTPTPPR